MLKRWPLLLLIFALACGKDNGDQKETLSSLTETVPITIEDPVPPEAETFQVNIKYVNFTDAQRLKYEQAVKIVKQVVASDEFKAAVIGHTYNGQSTYVDNAGLSNPGIYWSILGGNERLQNDRNNAIDMEVELYFEDNTTVGYTYPSSTRIWVNTKYFNANTASYVAGNLFHEWLHKLGYTHAATYSVGRDYSVPYAIGRIIRTLGIQYE